MLETAVGKVSAILSQRSGVTELEAVVDGTPEKVINYDIITGPVREGDQVVLNTTAVRLGLGTGGYHFVQCNISRPVVDMKAGGHIMKLRYTPQQVKVLSVEEEYAGWSEVFNGFSSLEGFPVVLFPLHSCLSPVALSFKTARPRTKIAYIMIDGAALPAWFSETVHELKEKGFIESVITAGHAFGGDLEAVNIYSALIAAKEIVKADAAVVGMGPGNVGTGTKWGFSGVQLGEAINAVNILGGQPIFCPRISFADQRPRHRGISHHTLTVLTKIALSPAVVVLPYLGDDEKKIFLKKQVEENRINEKHTVVWEYGQAGLEKIKEEGLIVSSMGRDLKENEEFFLTACAAGIYAGKMSMQVGFN
ncbi:MAG: DUF3866 family protein [Desulfitobacteriaceae bacterium]|nr:DUF3866 family protein [Desulfitobacteriaceae bacterium]